MRRSGSSKRNKGRTILTKLSESGYGFLIPALIVIVVVTGIPLLYTVVISFRRFILSFPADRSFIWFQNYWSVLNNPDFWSSLSTTVKFGLFAVVVQTILGILLAFCLCKVSKSRTIYMSILLIPMTISAIGIGLIWRMLLHADYGVVNYVLGFIGLARPWLGNIGTALGTIAAIDSWQWTPFLMILIYAGLLSLPEDVYEAARIDGATSFKAFTRITLPLMVPVVVTAAFFRFIDALKTFDLVFILTRGGPGTCTETLSFFIYKRAFTFLNLGEASAASILFLVAIAVMINLLSRNKLSSTH